MARSWAQLLGDADAAPEAEEERGGFFGRLRDSLGKSRRALTEQIAAAAFDPADDAAWERLEEALIAGDVGVRATAELVRRLEARGDVTDLMPALTEEIAAMLGEDRRLDVEARPSVNLVVGARGRDVVIVDTAGRLHTQTNLMDELRKVRSVNERKLEGAPHATRLVVDATTG